MSKQTVECCKHLHSKQTVNIKVKLIIVVHSKNFKGGKLCINLLILIVIIISTFYSHRLFSLIRPYIFPLSLHLSPCLPNHLCARSNPCRIFSLVLLLLFNYIFLLLTSTPALFSSTSLFSILLFTISSLCFIHSLLSYLSLQSHSPSRSVCSFSLLFVPRT